MYLYSIKSSSVSFFFFSFFAALLNAIMALELPICGGAAWHRAERVNQRVFMFDGADGLTDACRRGRYDADGFTHNPFLHASGLTLLQMNTYAHTNKRARTHSVVAKIPGISI